MSAHYHAIVWIDHREAKESFCQVQVWEAMLLLQFRRERRGPRQGWPGRAALQDEFGD